MNVYHFGPEEKDGVVLKIYQSPIEANQPVVCKMVLHGLKSLVGLGISEHYSFNLAHFYQTLQERKLLYTYVCSQDEEN